jgi:CRISPR-associated protein Csx10
MKVITYRITLLEPTLVTALDGDPNSAVAFDYLPGAVLRGAVIGQYLRANNLGPNQFDAAMPDARRLFFDGTTRYLNGYPLEQNERALPTPQSWQQHKEEVAKQKPKEGLFASVFDFAMTPRDHEKKQWQGVKPPFCCLNDDSIRLVKPERLITVHTARTRRFGRAMPPNKINPDEIPGAVYRYEALAAGQTFEAAVLCDDDADAATLLSLLEGETVLGGSRSGGYGQARIDNAKEVANWREVDSALTPDADGKLIVTLLSDALLRNSYGQLAVDPNVVTAALSKRLGVTLLPYQYADETQPKRWAFLRGTPVGGFNRKWGLPLPQAMAVKMGSVFVFHSPNCSEDELKELEEHGIGERRAEGFGRVAVN